MNLLKKTRFVCKNIIISLVIISLYGCSTLRVNPNYIELITHQKIYNSSSIHIIYRLDSSGEVIDKNVSEQIKEDFYILLQNTKEYSFNILDTEGNEYDHVLDYFEKLNRRDLEKNIASNELLDLFKVVDEELILLVNHRGFYRTGGSYFISALKGVLIGIITLGIFYTYPIPSKSIFEYSIIDPSSGKTIFFDTSYIQSDPRKEKILQYHIEKIINSLDKVKKLTELE